jgi:hypothetical protein
MTLRPTIALVAIGCFTGCASFSTMKTARAIDPGTSQVTFSGGVVGANVPYDDGSGRVHHPAGPQFELGVRYGIADGFDLGAKVWALGGELNSTISLVRSSVFDLALAPSIGIVSYNYGTDCDQFGYNCDDSVDVLELFAKIPLLFGVRFGPQQEHELVFGPEIVPVFVAAGDENTGASVATSGALLGGVVGVSFKVSPWLRLMPEVTVLTPISGYFVPPDSEENYINSFGRPNSVFYQVGLGFSWGDDGFGRPRYIPPPRREYYSPPPRQEYYPPPPPNYVPPPPPPPPSSPYRGDE